MNNKIIYKWDNLTDIDISKLNHEIRETPNITSISYKKWKSFGKVLVAKFNNKLAGVCAMPVFFDWQEIGVLFVFSEFRGQGIGKKLFNMAYEEAVKNNKNIFIVSRNQIIVKMMRINKINILKNFWKLPLTIKWYIILNNISLFKIFEYIRKYFKYPNSDAWVYGIKKYR